MKHGKRPSVKQKQIINHTGLNPIDWLVIKSLPNELHIVHRETNQKRIITLGGY